MKQTVKYDGDDALNAALKAARSPHDAAWTRALLAGVLAAPPGHDPDAWMALVAAAPDEALRAQLRALASEVAATRDLAAPPDPAARLALVRDALTRHGLTGLIVPRTDAHQGEYVPLCAERLAWLTGFTGSAGAAVVLADRAAVFSDGRYVIQLRQEVDADLYELVHMTRHPPHAWLAERVGEGDVIGYDPRLHTRPQLERIQQALEPTGARLAPTDDNLIDAVWPGRPAPPLAPAVIHPTRFTGATVSARRADVAQTLGDADVDAAVLTMPDSVAWLLNLRGGDVPYTPLMLADAIVRADGRVALFVDPRKLTPELRAALAAEDVTVAPPQALGDALAALGARGARVRVDLATARAWVCDQLEAGGATLIAGDDPCKLPKARKNEVERAGARAAHVRDGVAVTRFLHWLDQQTPDGTLTELSASDRLEALRREGTRFRGLSFPSISGAGPNGAIVHYRATEATNRPLEPASLYLIDSGAQYLDGTTDITRTVAIGPPSPEARDRYTRVLRGHITLARARFPAGTSGSQLDVLARHPLWDIGLDFDHGTGHGVGSYLGVHEGPQRISKAPNTVDLEPGMILSNEPGYYKTGAYGIRLENLVLVTEDDPPADDDAPQMLHFETLTLAPFDRRLIDADQLSPTERAWLDAYHARVRDTLSPLLPDDVKAWLDDVTRPL